MFCHFFGEIRWCFAFEPAQGPQLAAGQWMDQFRAALDAIDVNAAVGEVDGIPAQRRGGRTVPITVVGATSARCGFVMIIQASPRAYCPK